MNLSKIALLLAVVVISGTENTGAKKSPRSATSSRSSGNVRSSSSRKSSSSSAASSSSRSRSGRHPPVSKRRNVNYDEFDEYDEDDDIGYSDPFDDERDEYETEIDVEVEFEQDDDDDDYRPRQKPHNTHAQPRPRSRKSPPPKSVGRRTSSSAGGRNSRGSAHNRIPPSRKNSGGRAGRRYEEEDDYPPQRRRSSSPPRRGPGRGSPPRRRDSAGRVVPWTKQRQQPSTFTKGLSALRNSMPDPGSVKEAAMKSLHVARETTSGFSANLYREVKGLTSSELEQVMLKATRPDDTPVKGKHAERLVGVTYQISGRYDIYDAVLRKLWAKMAENDWRTTIKALYILHRFSADGSPEHAPALKARVRELRRTRDPKRKGKFFNSKVLQAGDDRPETVKYRAFMGRYAHYVLLRAQCFGGMFDEITVPSPSSSSSDKKKKAAPKPITSTSLRMDHLDAAKLLLKTGVACILRNGEENENTALAVERVASDLLGLTSSVAKALNIVLKDGNLKGAAPVLIKQWCTFYSEELLPQTRAMVKQTTPKLDAYGLFLPSRIGATVPPLLLQKGMKLDEVDINDGPTEESSAEDDNVDDASTTTATNKKDTTANEEKDSINESSVEEEIDKTIADDDNLVDDDVEKNQHKNDIDDTGIEQDDAREYDDEYEEYDDEEYYDDEDEL